MRPIRIVILCVLAAVLYGILHDQITARITIEYFTIGHRRVIDSTSPTLLALVWGVIATWWMGLLLGIPLALCATLGPWPKLDARAFVRPIAIALLAMAILAAVAGLVGWTLASRGDVWLVGRLAKAVPPDRHTPFLCALWTHIASYAAGALSALALCLHALRARRRAAMSIPRTSVT